MNRRLLSSVFILACLFSIAAESYACNALPTAIISGDDPKYVCVGRSIGFNGSASHDNDEDGQSIVAYSWAFGDGGTGTGSTVSHTYTTAGVYTVTLEVTDNEGSKDTELCTVYVMKVEIYDPAPSDFPKYIGINTGLTLKSKVTPSSVTGGTFSWLKVSGPGTVTFTPSVANITSFSADTVGSYTVKVQYTIGGVTCSDPSGTIVVCNAKMIFKVGGSQTSLITRAQTGTFEVVNGEGDPIDGASYSNWKFDGDVDVYDPDNTSSTWSGKIVQSGKAICSVTFGGITCEVNKNITVNARAGWSITPACDQDNVPGWVNPDNPHGGFPGTVTLGRCRNKITQATHVFTPRGTNYQDGYSTAKVDSGPNKDVWYIESTTLEIAWETVINKYTKSGTAPPDPPGVNFHEFNESKAVSADVFLQALKNHEYRGTGGNSEGHFAYMEEEESKSRNDAKAEIEENVGMSELLLKSSTGTEITVIELSIAGAQHEPPAGSNWDGNVWCFRFDWAPPVWAESHQDF